MVTSDAIKILWMLVRDYGGSKHEDAIATLECVIEDLQAELRGEDD